MSQLSLEKKGMPIYHTGQPSTPINLKGKSPHCLSQLLRKSYFQTLKPGKPPPSTFKTIRFTSLIGYKRFSKAILSFSFLFI
jgi:hypothetical protein